jgi:hypothetical protein
MKQKDEQQHGPQQKPGANSDSREGWAVPASYKTPVVLLIYTVKSGKSLGSDRGKKNIGKKCKRFIVIWDIDIS